MFHTGTWNTLVTPMLYSGGRVILLRRFDPDTVLDMIQTEHVSILWGVPTVYRRLMEHSRFETADFKSIRCCRCGAAPPALDMMEKYWEKGIYFCNGYGMTETSPGNLSMPAATLSITQLTQKRTSCGMLMPYNEARIVDDQDRSLPPGKKGELLFRGNLLFSGYWEDPEETEKAIRNGWFHTGDMAMKDEDGFYYIVGRKKNMYITSGENIFPQDVEEALFRNPNVMDVAVLGMPDKICGEVGKAVVVIRPGEVLTEEELRLFAQKELPAIQRPVYYTFVKALPRTAVGKLDMKELKRLYGSISGFQDGWNS
jgi:fatty-acyl-CoA synthase